MLGSGHANSRAAMAVPTRCPSGVHVSPPVARRRGVVALDHAMNIGTLDIAQPAVDLVMRFANSAGQHLADASAVTSMFSQSSIGIPDGLVDMHAVSLAAGDISAHGMAMASSVLSGGGMESLGSSVAGLAHVSSLQALHALGVDRLAVVQVMDPVAYTTLRASLDSLMGGLQAVVAQHGEAAIVRTGAAGIALETVPWTNALVLNVQQLVTALRAPAAGGMSVQAMVAAQDALQVAMAGAAVDATGLAATAAGALTRGAALGEMPTGLNWLMQVVLALTAMTIAAVPRSGKDAQGGDGSNTLPTRYDPPALETYFSRRPLLVLRRNSDTVAKITSFCVAILLDYQLGKWDANMPSRAVWARQLVESMGPAYIKIAQMVSTRVDIFPDVYIQEFCRLQDNVKTFATVEARQVLEAGLEQPVENVFDWLSEDPIAAASLGQVYRGKLRPEYGGSEVAVKVQRPGALENVSLDIYIMRRAALLFSQLPGMSDSWASALDDWAVRFFQEMDYTLEAHNTMTFKNQMASLQGIQVATVHPRLTSRHIIVTDWIEGERLGESNSEDVKALCSTLLNCYLIQLLETGLLHADPHPGNLMRTPDGRIVVLDFGLMTEVTEDQRIALVEFIAHLSVEDWDGVSHDLVKLGFLPDGLPNNSSHLIAPVMEKVMGALVRGGGLRNGISITGIAMELSGAALTYKLCIPPYFALVIRAFSVIEGIALKVDPKYAIVNECMPYMSRRLLTDNNPRMRAALKQLLYGNGSRLDLPRLQKMLKSFSSFTTDGAEEGGAPRLGSGPTFSAAYTGGQAQDASLLAGLMAGGDLSPGPMLTEPIKDILRVVFSKEGSYAQEIFVEEAVAAIDAMSREALGEALRLVSGSVALLGALRGAEALGPLRAMLMPTLSMLPSLGMPVTPAVHLSAEDRQALTTIRSLLNMVMPGGPGAATGGGPAALSMRAARIAGEMAPLLPELLPGIQATLELLVRQLVRRMATRLAEDLDVAGKNATVVRAQQAAQDAATARAWNSAAATYPPGPPIYPMAPQGAGGMQYSPSGQNSSPRQHSSLPGQYNLPGQHSPPGQRPYYAASSPNGSVPMPQVWRS